MATRVSPPTAGHTAIFHSTPLQLYATTSVRYETPRFWKAPNRRRGHCSRHNRADRLVVDRFARLFLFGPLHVQFSYLHVPSRRRLLPVLAGAREAGTPPVHHPSHRQRVGSAGTRRQRAFPPTPARRRSLAVLLRLQDLGPLPARSQPLGSVGCSHKRGRPEEVEPAPRIPHCNSRPADEPTTSVGQHKLTNLSVAAGGFQPATRATPFLLPATQDLSPSVKPAMSNTPGPIVALPPDSAFNIQCSMLAL
jgi:hypothetical protein